MSKQKHNRTTCFIGAVLLLGVICVVVYQGDIGSIASIIYRNFYKQTPPRGSSSPTVPAPVKSEAPQEPGKNFNGSDGQPLSTRSAPPGRNIYFISQEDYKNFRSALFQLLSRASGDFPIRDGQGIDTAASLAAESVPPGDLPRELAEESLEIRRFYRKLLKEKQKWDQYQQEQYKSILEDRIEPALIEVRNLKIENEDSLAHFLELEAALKLHTRLVRDVRIFHDEVQFQKKKSAAQQPYQLYDLKFKLGPFAREAALADALQQAVSSLSVGIYQQEAADVIERLCDEFLKPVRKLYDQHLYADQPSAQINYNYKIYVLFAKKLMNHSGTLLRQSSINLVSSSLGELDYINRLLSKSFDDLYQFGQNEPIAPAYLDLEELERDIRVNDAGYP